MKIIKTASGKQTIKMSKKEWKDIGKTAGWEEDYEFKVENEDLIRHVMNLRQMMVDNGLQNTVKEIWDRTEMLPDSEKYENRKQEMLRYYYMFEIN